jgi:IS5 family transposase
MPALKVYSESQLFPCAFAGSILRNIMKYDGCMARFYFMDISCHSLAPLPCLFLDVAVSDFASYLGVCLDLLRSAPHLIRLVDLDLDAHSKRKKAARLTDAQWKEGQRETLPLAQSGPEPIVPQSLSLAGGRPRTPALVVLVCLLARGYLGGFKSSDADTLLAESKTLAVFLAHNGLTLPGRSTMTELTNAVTNETRSAILDAEVALVLAEKLDDFKTLMQDSTAVEGNTEWPTDSRLAVALLGRCLRVGRSLPKFELPAIISYVAERFLDNVTEIDRKIDMLKSGKNLQSKRLRQYKKLLGRGRAAHGLITNELPRIHRALAALNVLPSRRARAARAVAQIEGDLELLARVLDNCKARVVDKTKVDAKDKVVSTSDPDAAFIVKGQRDPLVGYKPQLARSGGGFITGLMVPRGNAADSSSLAPMFEQVFARTKVVPDRAIYDDGYASAAGRDVLKAKGVKTISIGGSKGRRLTPPSDWNSEAHKEARNDRSAVESLMSTVKQGFDFGEVARRGVPAVTAELLEKVLAYNLCRIVALRAERARVSAAKALAAARKASARVAAQAIAA